MEHRGPQYVPFEVWHATAEKTRNTRTWMVGGLTAAVVLTIGVALIVPILNRRALIDDLVKRFESSEQIITHENHLGQDGVAFDYRKVEEADNLRRTELEGGNLMIFAGQQGGSVLDKRLRKLTTYSAAPVTQTPLYFLRRALSMASTNLQASVARSETRDGKLFLRDGRRTYVIQPRTGTGLANVDVLLETDLGRVPIARWRFERAVRDISRFSPESYTRIEPQEGLNLTIQEPVERVETVAGPVQIVRADISDKGDIFIGSWSKNDLVFKGKVNDDRVLYSWAPSGYVRAGNAETFREHLFYRQKLAPVRWPVKVELEFKPSGFDDKPGHKLSFTFNGPTCTVVPEYELGEQATEMPFLRHRLRTLVYEASLAESSDATLRISTETRAMKDPEAVINNYRLALAFDQDINLRAYRISRSRIYYELYRAYSAARQKKPAQQALLFARKIYRTDDPWLDEKIREGLIAEDLVQVD